VPPHEDWLHFIENALRAHHIYHRDTEYVVEGDGEVVIVDEFTGRKMTGRRWSDGLHQAVETKEGLKPRQENQTLATITLQNYFRMFKKLAGMTGTAITEAGEFHKIYGLDVVSIPTNLPIARRTTRTSSTAPRREVEGDRQRDRRGPRQGPARAGRHDVDREVRDRVEDAGRARHPARGAERQEPRARGRIVARAGEKGSIVVRTNMAGRGTDIKLGGNFEYRLNKALEEAGLTAGDLEKLDEISAIRERVRAQCKADEQVVLSLGGLYVLGTERHEARRIDNQLRGRTGARATSASRASSSRWKTT
jgi:preprotein translocase subunit SecA